MKSSAFWGQSFVTELTRIAAHSADKFQAKKLAVSSSEKSSSENETPVPEKAA